MTQKSPAELEAHRSSLLVSFYEHVNGTLMPAARSDLATGGLSAEEFDAAITYLQGAKFIEHTGLDGDLQLTYLGIVEVERRKAESVLGLDAAGWLRVDEKFLESHAASRTADQALAYIDGRRPQWHDCMPDAAPRRAVARTIAHDLAASAGTPSPMPLFWTILGATGEGKSTALMQIAVDVALKGASFVVLWRRTGGRLPAEIIAKFPSGPTYLLISDDGEEIAGDALVALQKSGRKDVYYCLAATTTDWQRVNGEVLPFRSYSQYESARLRGLDQADAEIIVKEWEQYGPSGLRELEKEPDTTARASALVRATQEEASLSEGAFFGGMLRVRYGELLKDHLRVLLRKLVQRKKDDGLPYPQVYMLIAAAHTNQLRLTPEILASAAKLDVSTVRSVAIDPLSDEAVVTMAGGYVFTRHRSIATASLELAESSGLNLPELYATLVRAAISVGKHKHVEGYENFLQLSRVYERTRLDIATTLAEVVHEEEPNNLANVYNLGRILMLAERHAECSAVFERAVPRLGDMRDKASILGSLLRVFYYEWGYNEFKRGNCAVSVWLSLVSIADFEGVDQKSRYFRLDTVTQDHLERALTATSTNLIRLHRRTGVTDFLEAANGVLTLTRQLNLSPSGERVQRSVEEGAKDLQMQQLSGNVAKLLLREGARLAYEERELSLPAVPSGQSLQFTELFARLGV